VTVTLKSGLLRVL